MATITFRLPDDEKATVEARAARSGISVGAFIRGALDLDQGAPALEARMDAAERRLSTLEGIAGL